MSRTLEAEGSSDSNTQSASPRGGARARRVPSGFTCSHWSCDGVERCACCAPSCLLLLVALDLPKQCWGVQTITCALRTHVNSLGECVLTAVGRGFVVKETGPCTSQ